MEAETRHHSTVPFSSVLAQAKATYIFMASKYMLQKYVVAEFPELLSITYLTLKIAAVLPVKNTQSKPGDLLEYDIQKGLV